MEYTMKTLVGRRNLTELRHWFEQSWEPWSGPVHTWRCKKCQKEFKTEYIWNLYQHFDNSHVGDLTVETPPRDLKVVDVINTPEHDHDCLRCKYLGHVVIGNERQDLWFCSSSSIPTLIARWGSEGSQYSSGLTFGVSDFAYHDYNAPLAQALMRAVALGLISMDNRWVKDDLVRFK